jgi:hypothetical protein
MQRIIWLLICALAVSACSFHGDSVRTQETVYRSKKEKIDFSLSGWSFFWGVEGPVVGDPFDAFLHLYAEKGNFLVRIDSPNDVEKLKGVHVEDQDQALNIVRLFTQPSSYGRFTIPLKAELPNSPIDVKTRSNHFVVTRQLVDPARTADGKFPVYEVCETISPKGKYSIVTNRLFQLLEKRPVGIRGY